MEPGYFTRAICGLYHNYLPKVFGSKGVHSQKGEPMAA
jgi:hypothetical protein